MPKMAKGLSAAANRLLAVGGVVSDSGRDVTVTFPGTDKKIVLSRSGVIKKSQGFPLSETGQPVFYRRFDRSF